MTETGNNIVKKKIASLQEYTPDDSLWNVIEARLDFEKVLSDKIRELPDHSPADDLWTSIEATIEPPKVRRLYPRYWYYAASIAVILVSSTILTLRLTDTSSHEVQITTEIIYTGTPVENENNRWPGPVQYINSLCKLNSQVCNSARFVEKKQMLEELDKDEQQILRFEEQFGSSETLEKSKVRIERVRAEVIKELLQMIEG
jgi:hypothetical protein